MRFRLFSLVFLAVFPLSTSLAQPKLPAATIGGVSVKGLTLTEATRRLRRTLAPKLEKRVALSAGSKIAFRRRADLGFSLDIGKMLARAQKGQKRVPIAFRVDQNAAKKSLSRLQNSFSASKRDARPIYGRGRVQIRPETIGQRLNVSRAAANLKISAEKNATQTRFRLPVNRSAPRLTRARLKGINAIVGTFSTNFNPGQVKRTLNMRVAARSIDGTLLSPGEVFSLNKTVGERTQARGYRTAIIFENGKKIPGLGGGVSQITGTLFNAALVGGLPIVTYRTHSRPVAYLPIARDATVAWNSFDMKFKNNTQAPIFVSYKLSGSRLSATLFGAKTGRKVRISSSVKRLGARNIKAKLFRVIRVKGKVVAKETVGDSTYNWKKDDAD